MQILWNLVIALQIIAAVAMIGLVLVQHGKGADMGASFGSGASGSLFGASGSANFLSRSTSVCAALFFACTLGLAYVGSNGTGTRPEGTSVLERARAAGAPASGAAPAAQIPTAPTPPASTAQAAPGITAPASVPAQTGAPAPQKP